MTPSFRIAVVGPSRVGKTTLLTAVLSDTEALLSGTQVTVSMDERTANRVRKQQKELRRALEIGEFDAAALGGTQEVVHYQVAIETEGDASVRMPFEMLDYPGAWLDPDERAQIPGAVAEWPGYIEHVRQSIMLLVPIDASVLMEAMIPRQRAAVGELLGLLDVEEVGKRWAKSRNAHPDEPAVVVLAPLKCEKYFDDNGGTGNDAARLRRLVQERYRRLLEIIRAETPGRPVRIVYAPIDTYGCVELMEARWKVVEGQDVPEFEAHYRFRGRPPQISVRAAGTVMQELCRAVLHGQDTAEDAARRAHQQDHDTGVARRAESKGFWGTIEYHLTGESIRVRRGIEESAAELERVAARQRELRQAAEKLVGVAYDARVEVWSHEDWR